MRKEEIRKELVRIGNEIFESDEFTSEETSQLTYYIYLANKILREKIEKESK